MKKVGIKIAYFPSFEIVSKKKSKLDIFAFFLITELDSASKIKFYHDWPYFLDQDNIAGNAHQLIKDKFYIHINLGFADFEIDENFNKSPRDLGKVYKISIENFQKALREWCQVLEADPQPKEVTITQDDQGKIAFKKNIRYLL